MIHKFCPDCERRLPITDFYKVRKCDDAVQGSCKECQKKYKKAWYLARKKECGHCHKVKSFNCFYKKSNSKDGLQPFCKKCQNAYNKNRRKKINGIIDEGLNNTAHKNCTCTKHDNFMFDNTHKKADCVFIIEFSENNTQYQKVSLFKKLLNKVINLFK